MEADFTSLHLSSLEFTNDERVTSIGVDIVDDSFTEKSEQFSVRLQDIDLRQGEHLMLSDQERGRIMLDETNIIIVDNDSKFNHLITKFSILIMFYLFRSYYWIS